MSGASFTLATIAQASWSVALLIHADRRLLLAGAAMHILIIATYLVSRTVGIPFGPAAFEPETFDRLSVAVTSGEVAVVTIALTLALRGLPCARADAGLPGGAPGRRPAALTSPRRPAVAADVDY